MAVVALSGIFASDGDAPPSLAQRVFCIVALAALIALAVRVARLAVILDDEGVVARNVFRDIAVGWDSIADVEPPPTYGTLRKAGIRIHTVSGTVVSASAFVRGRMDSDSVGNQVVAAIRDRLRPST